MNIEPQKFLDLIEKTNSLCFWDIEATGLKGDYNSILVVSVLPYKNTKPITLNIKQLGNDLNVVRAAKEILQEYNCWCGYYSKGFDLPMLNTRLLKWEEKPVEKRHHIDLYFSLKANLLTGRKSMSHLSSWLNTEQQKMNVPVDTWSEMGFKMEEHMPTMIQRCECDVIELRDLYKKTRHIIKDIKL